MENKYRIVEKIYHEFLTSEDGPGSLTNVGCHKPIEKIIWEKTLDKEITPDYFPIKFYDDNNGFTSLSFSLELFNKETGAWGFVGHLRTETGSEEEYYEKFDREDDQEYQNCHQEIPWVISTEFIDEVEEEEIS